ncbi:hypothetical protein TELCIR_14536 [Teladorsagia circumcincta]|uniref:Uncharacterized protein n=1 Tax=Teladorsagia circumcincta TaxID=45464 RepID=A0A2G9U2W3_TELCI|nr:hypothetical protein TELCIR_14536 [Teladorsagia circumcincta]
MISDTHNEKARDEFLEKLNLIMGNCEQIHKKKKAQVSIIHSKVKEMKDKDKDGFKEKSELQASISVKPTKAKHATQQQQQQASTGVKKGGLREMNTPEFARSRRHSESEQSVASELSAAPDWLDEVVGPDDVDDDFSAMAAASEFLMSASGEDAGSSRAQTPQPLVRSANTQHQQKRRTRRDKRRRRGRSSGNEGASSSDKSHRNAIGAERIPKKTLAAELNEERRRREDEYLRSNNAGRRSTTRDAVAADMAVGSNIWETWNRISYQVFEAIVRDDARLAQHDASFQPNNTWLCVPQLIANLACLTSVAAASNGPGEPLRRELMNESAEAGSAASKMLTSLFTCPFELWRGGEPHLKKENAKETMTRDIMMAKSNQRCPIFAWASRTGILEVPTNATSVFLYFVIDVERSITGPQLVEMIREVQKTTPETHTAYIPIWWPHDSVSNVAKGIKNSLDAEPLFSHGGFGDFAMEDAEVA